MNKPFKRRQVSDRELRQILEEYLELMVELTDDRGTWLDPKAVADAIRAIRTATTPKQPPKTIYAEHADWSNLFEVPIDALGLRLKLHQRLRTAAINTVGILTSHSPAGLQRSYQTANGGVKLVKTYQGDLERRLTARGLSFATDNSSIPLTYIFRHPTIHFFKWWTNANEVRFANLHQLVTLGDLSQLTIERIREKPLFLYRTGEDYSRPLSESNPDDVALVVEEFNSLLRKYDLPEIGSS